MALISNFATWIVAQPNIVKADEIECDCILSTSEKVDNVIFAETNNGEKEIDIFVDGKIYSLIGFGNNTFRLNSVNIIDTDNDRTVLSTASGYCSISDEVKCNIDLKFSITGKISKVSKLK